jgi:hypothetical protein
VWLCRADTHTNSEGMMVVTYRLYRKCENCAKNLSWLSRVKRKEIFAMPEETKELRKELIREYDLNKSRQRKPELQIKAVLKYFKTAFIL